MTGIKIFDNQAITIDAQAGTYLDWSDHILGIHSNSRDLNEGLLHRDPDKAAAGLKNLEHHVAKMREYLTHKGVV